MHDDRTAPMPTSTLRRVALAALGLLPCAACSGADEGIGGAPLDAGPATGRDAGILPTADGRTPSPTLRNLVLNEVAASGEPADWFEVHNTGEVEVSLGEVRFRTGADGPGTAFPAEARVAPGGYYVQRVDDAFPGFRLGRDEDLTLLAADGAQIDRVDWQDGDSPAGGSFGRIPDGTGPFRTLEHSTPGAQNEAAEPMDGGAGEPDAASRADAGDPDADASAPSPAGPSLILNEVGAGPGASGDFVEVLNRGASPLDFTGWSFTDADLAHRAMLPAGELLAPGMRRVFYRGAPDGFDFGLGAGDAALLLDPTGLVVDLFDWTPGEIPAGGSFGRIPDGVGDPRALTTATPGTANVEAAVALLRVNEVFPFGGAADGPDWVEIVNVGTAEGNLDGWRLADDGPGNGTELRGSPVVPAGRRVLLVEGEDFDFGLGAEDAVRLIDPAGEAIDGVSWSPEILGEGQSLGRTPDGTGPFQALDEPTPGDRNP